MSELLQHRRIANPSVTRETCMCCLRGLPHTKSWPVPEDESCTAVHTHNVEAHAAQLTVNRCLDDDHQNMSEG